MAPSRSITVHFFLLFCLVPCQGFQSSLPNSIVLPIRRQPPHIPSHDPSRVHSSSSSSSALQATPVLDLIGSTVHDLVYQAESAASALANNSLDGADATASAFPILYLAGLLTSLSPCVWGLLPLTLSYISTAAGEREDQQAVWPTVAFAGGLAAVFCSMGVVATQVGGVLGGSSVVGGVFSSVICLVMGLKILELISLPLPSIELRGRVLGFAGTGESSSAEPVLLDATGQILPTKGASAESGSLFRTFLLGGSSALVASPCATPVLTSILAFVAKASNPAYGALLLFGYTLGYATPLLLVAGTGGQALARSSNKLGPWVTPITGSILLLYGTNGLLTSLFGDPSLAALTINN